MEPIPEHFDSAEEAGSFWDVHDLAEYWDQTRETDLIFNLKRRHYLIGIDPRIAKNCNGFPKQMTSIIFRIFMFSEFRP